ncbi:hypothetical protein D1164_02755 [Mariniphaga sediminis]|uniref:Uncharacterized protein n=1 Tax=Mariniphaga sediminis TaxID=1628158 RepID=A0A399CYP1_9BACT|nr:hypothetical protein D1164_15710 [Mariniphaga sediminis]RIH66542.1 hypothetical protein D1164_02755 [Mariniphaga sediminis]
MFNAIPVNSNSKNCRGTKILLTNNYEKNPFRKKTKAFFGNPYLIWKHVTLNRNVRCSKIL